MITNIVHIRIWLRLEAVAGILLWAALFHTLGGSWWELALWFLLPDLSMLGYLVNPRWGAHAYNFAHNYAVAALGLGIAWWMGAWHPLWLVWPLHIAVDRAAGYGLKSEEGFHFTHLARP